MALKKQKSGNSKASDKSDQIAKWRTWTGVALALISVSVFIAVVAYFFFWDVDQAGASKKNLYGKVGNYLATALVKQWFGVASVCIPLAGFIVALHLLRVGRRKTFKRLIFLLLLMPLTSITLGICSGSSQMLLGGGLGGDYGRINGQKLVEMMGKLGSAMLLAVAFFLLCCYIIPNFPWRVKSLAQKIAAFFRRKKTEENLSEIPTADSNDANSDANSDSNSDSGNSGEGKQAEEEKDAAGEKDVAHKPENGTDIKLTIENLNDGDDDDSDSDNDGDNSGETYGNGNESPDSGDGSEEDKEDEDIEMSIDGLDGEQQLDEVLASHLPYDPKADLSRYEHPPVDLLNDYPKSAKSVSADELELNKNKIVRTLGHYNISIAEIKATIGPTVTLYEIVPAPGVRISKIKGLENDIALSLAALGIRIIAPIPGKGTIGIEVPNQHSDIVSMHSVVKSAEFNDAKFDLPIALGKTITNKTFVVDLAKMPHLLIAGATGQGKSVGLNAVLTSLLYKMHPSQLKLVLVDPKKVELPLYAKVERHFLAKLPDAEDAIITDNQKVIYTLNSLCIEMDARYELLKAAAVRNIKEYNQKFIDRRLNPEHGHRYLPYIVLVIDEFADLIMTAGREVEMPIARLAQLARAIGIHLVIATQRPTTNVITGLIKANFPARIAFRVTSMIDSRTILDTPGAQHLIGKGDMLVSTGSDIVRVQCAFVDTPEVEKIVDFIGGQQGYPTAFMLPEYVPEGGDGEREEVDLSRRDSMFEQAARLVVETQQGSTSLIQRKLNLGYNRAGRIMDQLEAAGIVGAPDGSKPRQVRIPDVMALEQLLRAF
ncbi:MAG: DNA translocase FtsK [Prevotellaceae bacterium]|jgi:S-DNA-T family DNA segregation ATPase FtsK/SpoIIIE|nr:DNA translocase FtsK [Prevotellaceae bacterium]